METTVAEVKRAQQITAIRDLADWLTDNPAMPMPTLDLHRHLGNADGTEAENLAAVRDLAARLGVEAEERLDDRTVLRFRVNKHVWYELFAWHKGGRPGKPDERDAELERLRAEVTALRAAAALQPDADLSGLSYSREADDPTPVSPARVPLHTGAVTDDGLVDETDTDGEPSELVHIAPAVRLEPSGLTKAADQTRGVLAGTTPVVTYFSFGHGQSDPDTGKSLLDHYVTVVAPTYEACREAMIASRFGRAWSFDYLAGTPKATEWIPRWTEHEVIVAPGIALGVASSTLKAARELLTKAWTHYRAGQAANTGCGQVVAGLPWLDGTSTNWAEVTCKPCLDEVPF